MTSITPFNAFFVKIGGVAFNDIEFFSKVNADDEWTKLEVTVSNTSMSASTSKLFELKGGAKLARYFRMKTRTASGYAELYGFFPCLTTDAGAYIEFPEDLRITKGDMAFNENTAFVVAKNAVGSDAIPMISGSVDVNNVGSYDVTYTIETLGDVWFPSYSVTKTFTVVDGIKQDGDDAFGAGANATNGSGAGNLIPNNNIERTIKMSEVNRNYLLSDGDPEFYADLKQALSDACTILKNHLHKYASGDVYQSRYKDGQYTPTPNAQPNYWTESFYPGQLWLAYEVTHDEAFRDIAEKNVLDFHRRVVMNDEIDWHHDIGFLYTLSSVAPYKLTGNELARESALMAAYSLSRRFRFKGAFIQSMGDDGNYCPQNYRFIVDTMMNLPLLFWAAEETGNMTYKDKAMRHLRTCMKYSIREDGSSYHHFLMDHETGGPIRGLTLQGAHDESFWSRGHSWIIYGLAVAYDYTGDKTLLDDFVKVTDAFVRNLPESDSIPYWDFIYNDGSGEERDSSAAAIACCGIMEMARLIPHDICNMEKYIEAAKKMLKSLLTKRYRITPDTGEEGFIRETMGSKPHGGKPCCATYADYFFLEALIRATSNWENRYW